MTKLPLTDAVTFRLARPGDLAAISALSARVFGPGRFARTAYRVREGAPDISRFCRVAERGGRIVAAVRLTEAVIGTARGILLLGPLAVDPGFAGRGYGRRLVRDVLDHARSEGLSLIVLIGDEPYYGRLGFRPVPPGKIVFPGPADSRRILAAELDDGALARLEGGRIVAAALSRQT